MRTVVVLCGVLLLSGLAGCNVTLQPVDLDRLPSNTRNL